MKTRAMPETERRRLLGKIHIAQKQLGLSEENYRTLLWAVTGKDSCSQMDGAELQSVMAEFVARGFKVSGESNGGAAPKPPASSPLPTPHSPTPTLRYKIKDLSPVQGKVLALWCEGKRLGVIRGGDKALDAFVKRQTGVERLTWLTEMEAAKAIEGLKAIVDRAKGEG